jgi:uncharacterized Zn finger protein (UPF0148 family)
MAIKIQCPSCGASLSAPDSYHGKTVACPKCNNRFPALTEQERQIEEERRRVEEEKKQAEKERQRLEAQHREAETAKYWEQERERIREEEKRKDALRKSGKLRVIPVEWWILAVFLPIVGLILGIIATAQERENGVALLLVSIVFPFLWGVLLGLALAG